MTDPAPPIVHLRDLGSERYILRRPLPILVMPQDDGCAVYWEEGAAWGHGRLAGEAMAALGQDIVRLYEDIRDGVPGTLKILSKSERRALMEEIRDLEKQEPEEDKLEKKRIRQRKWYADRAAKLKGAKAEASRQEVPPVLRVDGASYSIVMVPKLVNTADTTTLVQRSQQAAAEYQQELWREILATQPDAPRDLPTFISKVIADNPGVFK